MKCEHCQATEAWVLENADPPTSPHGSWPVVPLNKRWPKWPDEEIAACECRCHEAYQRWVLQ